MLLSRRWSAPWWGWLMMVAVVGLCLSLARWQWHRAAEKEAMIAGYTAASQAALQPLEIAAWLSGHQEGQPRPVMVRGMPQVDRQLLLDSQINKGRVGYRVWTPLKLADRDAWVLVDRGWVPADPAARSRLPEVAMSDDPVQWQGLWRSLPRAGWRTGSNDCDRSRWPRVVQYPTQPELECLLQSPLIEGLLLLSPDQPLGYVREWVPADMPPEKHLAYAVQWLGLAVAAVVIFGVVNLHKS